MNPGTVDADADRARRPGRDRARVRPARPLDRRRGARTRRDPRLHRRRSDLGHHHPPVRSHPPARAVDPQPPGRAVAARRRQSRAPASSASSCPSCSALAKSRRCSSTCWRERISIRDLVTILEALADTRAQHARSRSAGRARAPGAGPRHLPPERRPGRPPVGADPVAWLAAVAERRAADHRHGQLGAADGRTHAATS